MGYDRYCTNCGDGMYRAHGILSPIGELCKSCFKELFIDDMTLEQCNELYDDAYFTSIYEMTATYDIYEIAVSMGYDINYGE